MIRSPSLRILSSIGLCVSIATGCGSKKAGTPASGDAGNEEMPDAGTVTACDAPGIEACYAAQKICSMVNGMPQCNPCPSAQFASSDGTCAAIPGMPIEHDFSVFTTMPGEEVLGLCQSWTLNNPTELWINAVELTQDAASHHSNWTFSPDDKYTGPDGVWKCTDRDWDQLRSALAGGVLYAQSTQATHEVQKFPTGAAVRIPPYSRIVGDVHLLNTTRSTVTGHAKMTIYALSASDVKVKLVPFHLTYTGLNIPPHANSRFTGTCDLQSAYRSAGQAGFETNLFFILPHTHKMATRFFVNMVGGPMDNSKLIEVNGFTSEAHGRAFDPPISTHGAMGLSFGCEYANNRDVAIHWGFGDQEMCELLGFSDSNVAFEARIDTAKSEGTDGSIELFSGPCDSLVFDWDFNKPGGPGPM